MLVVCLSEEGISHPKLPMLLVRSGFKVTMSSRKPERDINHYPRKILLPVRSLSLLAAPRSG